MTAIITTGPLIGPIIAALRTAAGITQTELAHRTGVASSQISKYEGSLVTPDLDTTARLMAGLAHRLCAVPYADAVSARQRQAVIDAAHHTDPQVLHNALADLHAADPLDDGGNIYAELNRLRADLTAARQQVTDMRAAIATAHYTLVEAIR